MGGTFITLGSLWWPCMPLCFACNRSQNTRGSVLVSKRLNTFSLSAWMCSGLTFVESGRHLCSSLSTLRSGLRHVYPIVSRHTLCGSVHFPCWLSICQFPDPLVGPDLQSGKHCILLRHYRILSCILYLFRALWYQQFFFSSWHNVSEIVLQPGDLLNKNIEINFIFFKLGQSA